MERYNAIADNVKLLFSSPSDEVWTDDEDDNIIINSLYLPSMHKDSIIAAISIDSDDIIFFTYSKLVNNRRIWLRNEVLVKLKNERAFWPRMDSVILNSGVKSIEYIENREYSIICYTENDVATLANMLYDTSWVIYSTPDFYSEGEFSTSDPYFDVQWGLKNTGQGVGTSGIDIKAEEAWAFLQQVIGSMGANIKIAVVDDGVEDHEDLYTDNGISKVIEGYTANGNGTGSPKSGDYHGQCCAGIIAASHNDKGVAGVAPNARIVPIKITRNGSNSFFNHKKIANAITLAWLYYGAQIMSCSWTETRSDLLTDAINNAAVNGRDGKGCIMVFGSGNRNRGTVEYPAYLSRIIAVGGVDRCGKRCGTSISSPFSCDPWPSGGGSSYGANLNVVAPGSSVPTIDRMWPNGYDFDEENYIEFRGTSASCPHVAGIAALMISVNPNLTREQVIDIIESTAQKVGNYNYMSAHPSHPNGAWHYEVGYGLVDAHKSVVHAFMHEKDITISGEDNIDRCNEQYTLNLYRSDLFTCQWSCSYHLVITGQEGYTVTITPVQTGNATITAKIYAQDRLIYTITKSVSVDVSGLSSLFNPPLYTSSRIINTNTTWAGDNRFLPIDAIILSGATLTITGNIHCAGNAQITLEPGARLIIDGGTLTAGCEGEMWEGIIVEGNPNQPLTQSYQGYIEIKNGGKISNAECAVTVNDGGIVKATNAHFRNNAISVKFHEISSTQSGTSGTFTNTDFVIDENYFGEPSAFEAHLITQDCGNISVSGCTFSISPPIEENNDKGILVKNTRIDWFNANYLTSTPVTLPTAEKRKKT